MTTPMWYVAVLWTLTFALQDMDTSSSWARQAYLDHFYFKANYRMYHWLLTFWRLSNSGLIACGNRTVGGASPFGFKEVPFTHISLLHRPAEFRAAMSWFQPLYWALKGGHWFWAWSVPQLSGSLLENDRLGLWHSLFVKKELTMYLVNVCIVKVITVGNGSQG